MPQVHARALLTPQVAEAENEVSTACEICCLTVIWSGATLDKAPGTMCMSPHNRR